jgi:hypothetical protein
MKFYTTPEYENKLNTQFQNELDEKQNEIGKNSKYTARAFVCQPERIFIIKDKVIYCGEISEYNISPKSIIEGGKEYKLEENFLDKILNFIDKYQNYRVIFYPDGKYGPTISYYSETDAIPARIESLENKEIFIEIADEDQYDICVL